jgi:glycine/D-amino acid oxidase-like deaminating enzyme
MHVGVLGGGLQGCCVALALADRGARVTLFDRNPALIMRAGVANEGKIHLGYMYAGDPSLQTARTMMTGALAFQPFLRRHLGSASPALRTSVPAIYVVHRDAQASPEAIGRYLMRVHELVAERSAPGASDYFGLDLQPPPRRLSSAEREARFNGELAVEAYETAEVAINPTVVAETLREHIAGHSRIEVRLGCHITGAAEDGTGVRVNGRDRDGAVREGFDHVVNALWDGRLALDAAMGRPIRRAWIHRLKYGVSFRLPEGAEVPPSATFVLGPFGEVVSYADGTTYLTWYPTCLRAISHDVQPPDWANFPGEPLRSEVINGTFEALRVIVPALRGIEPTRAPEITVKGGAIVAWGATDIYDPESELHRRYEIGITTNGRVHSVDPGKLTMAPFFAEQCADRILTA